MTNAFSEAWQEKLCVASILILKTSEVDFNLVMVLNLFLTVAIYYSYPTR